jgi:gluconolactonase
MDRTTSGSGPDNDLWFTDPFYKRPWWKHETPQQDGQHVYYLWRPIAKDWCAWPTTSNNPTASLAPPTARRFMSPISAPGRLIVYDIQPDGTLANKTLFCELGSDGMTIDAENNLYLTGRGVTVFNKEGQKIEHIAVEEGWTANVCFGGADRQTLFITASKGLYSIRLRVKGMDPAK